jgi:hypothetical protein
MKDVDTRVQKLEAERIDIKHNLEKYNEQLEHEKQKLRHYTQLLGALKLHNIDELENLMDATQDTSSIDSRYQLKKIDPEDFEGIDEESLKKEIHKLEENLKSQTPNLTVIEKYKELVSY